LEELLAEVPLVTEPAESPLEPAPEVPRSLLELSELPDAGALAVLLSPLLPFPPPAGLAAEAELSLLSEPLSELDEELDAGAEFLWA
jgi:hypothetical protein